MFDFIDDYIEDTEGNRSITLHYYDDLSYAFSVNHPHVVDTLMDVLYECTLGDIEATVKIRPALISLYMTYPCVKGRSARIDLHNYKVKFIRYSCEQLVEGLKDER